MTSFNNRILDMLLHVLVFTQSFPQYFLEGSVTRRLIEEIEAAVKKLLQHRTAQHSGKGDLKVLTTDRGAARKTLKSLLRQVSRTGKGLNLPQFWLSRDQSDKALMNEADLFAERAAPLKQLFLDSHMAPDFIERLVAAKDSLQKAIREQAFIENVRVKATKAIDEARDEALSALAELDPILENLIQNDKPALAVWRSARHVERYARSSESEPDPAVEAPSPPPISDNGAAAAQA